MGLLFVLYTLFPQSLISVSNPWRSFCANMAIFKGTQPLLLFEVLRTKDTVSGAPSLVWTSLTLRTLRTTLIVCLKKIHTYFCCSENWWPGRRQRNKRTLNVNQLLCRSNLSFPTCLMLRFTRRFWGWRLRTRAASADSMSTRLSRRLPPRGTSITPEMEDHPRNLLHLAPVVWTAWDR